MRKSWDAATVRRTSGHAAATAGARGRLRGLAAVTVGALLAVTAGSAAQADDLYNTIDGETATVAGALDAQVELMKLVANGDPGTTYLRAQARSSSIDGFEGCNLQKGPVTFALWSSNPSAATVEPASVEFTTCTNASGVGEMELITIKPGSTGGSTTITATVKSAPVGSGSWNLAPATFRVEVAPPPNQLPTVQVVGINAATYPKGSPPPAPTCEASDPEDGPSSPTPTIGLPRDADGNTIPLDADGLGERLVTCKVTDSRGATATATAKYSIVDPNEPTVRYVLSKPKPANGWYRDEVALDWVVTEPESPRSLAAPGCERVWITADQKPTTYTCTATSSGGTTSVTSEALGKDATAPVVTPTINSPSVVVNGLTWYSQVPSISWDAVDAVSGYLEGSKNPVVKVAGEGRNQMARTVATDNAGNTGGTSVQYINVDASAPVVEATLVGTPAYDNGTTAWFKDQATIEVTATDPFVQPLERGSGLADDPTGPHVVTETTDFSVTATDNVGHVGTSNTVPVTVDATAPVVTATCPKLPVIKGLSFKASWTASDEAGGSGLRSAASGTVALDTSSVGRKTVAAPVATDKVGHTSEVATCEYQVVYAFIGFLDPIDNFGVFNKVKAGSAVPVKFSLAGNQGMGILTGAPVATKVTCPSSMRTDSLEETAPATSVSGLKYDSRTTVYTYTWKTATSLAGTCQKLTVNLADGTSKTALFNFTR